ncbi:unnamed protein product [Echinostoma caproni]|uniref:Uncharacterized protein n=1 Tax=Echinostoma caproni TaxID=27848 RepID=A0A183AY38_9TREM|nr:unnamed protein product [Echinostoma caproni]
MTRYSDLLGCLEWRANPTIVGRAPRPKSANHRLDIPSIGELPRPEAEQTNSRSSMCTRTLSECASSCPESDIVKSSRGSQRNKAIGGADALLRRLRMRPLSKGSRAKTPTPVGSEIAGRLASAPVRSSSTPRTSCMSKSFIEWSGGAETCVFPSCSHGSRLNMTTNEESSFLPPVTNPQRTESYPTVSALCAHTFLR